MKRSKLFMKYEVRIINNTMGESDIIGFKSHLNGSRSNSTLTSFEQGLLLDLIVRLKPIITPTQTDKGLKWLKNVKHEFSEFQAKVIDNFKEFNLIDFVDESTGYRRPDYRPVYRVRDHQGEFFDYYAYPWQTGTPLEIL